MRTVFTFLVCAASLVAQNRNQLSPKEVAEGWVLLYDGESAFGWTPEGGAEWSTGPDGDLTAKSGDSGDMLLNMPFGEFQLSCDMKAFSARGSGLVLHGVLLPPPKTGDKWHTYSVVNSGGKLVVSIDGKKLFEQAVRQPGSISLHYRKGDNFSIKSLKLKPLAMTYLFNGKDLTGWRVVPARDAKSPAEWTVRDAAIHVERGPGQLETEAQYRDFILQLEVRTNSADPKLHPNSGVFLRGEANAFWTGYESQIRNEHEYGEPSKPVDFGTGGIYHYQPARRVVSSDNVFFTKTIVARGPKLAVWVNGIQVSEWEDPNPDGPSVVPNKQSKRSAGTVSLQAHDPTTNLDFRNIRIEVLE